MEEDKKFAETDLSFDEYKNQEVVLVDDTLFDELDEMFGIVPGTDELVEENNKE